MIIEESGMSFGDYDESDVFHIEKSTRYRKYLMSNGIKSCEFILLRGRSLYFIEAKKSCPNQITGETTAEKRMKYNKYICDIVDKVRHSISVYASILLGIQSSDDVPEKLLEKNLYSKDIKVLLVVKDAKPEWLIPLQAKLNCELGRERKIWNFNFFVINEQMARSKALVI